MRYDQIIVILLVSLVFFVIVLAMILSHIRTVSSPQHKCAHSFNTIQTHHGKYSTEYLSTCTKCGKQETHMFSGLNA